MAGYTKLFNSILASTIWGAGDHTRLVWITMLAMADKDGVVEASIPGLASFAHVPVEACERALAELSGPDPYSRTKDHEGRRIEPVDGGWRLLNHATYRAKLSADERRAYLRNKQREYRARKAVSDVSTPVANVSDTDTLSTQAEADTEATPKEEEERKNAPTATTAASRVPLVSKRRGHAAFEGARGLYVLHRQHQRFRELLNRPDADAVLFAWYEATCEEWFTGSRQHEIPDVDMFAFWDARFKEHWPPSSPKPKASHNDPDEAQRRANDAKYADLYQAATKRAAQP